MGRKPACSSAPGKDVLSVFQGGQLHAHPWGEFGTIMAVGSLLARPAENVTQPLPSLYVYLFLPISENKNSKSCLLGACILEKSYLILNSHYNYNLNWDFVINILRDTSLILTVSQEWTFCSQGGAKVSEGRNHFWSLFCIPVVVDIGDGIRECVHVLGCRDSIASSCLNWLEFNLGVRVTWVDLSLMKHKGWKGLSW